MQMKRNSTRLFSPRVVTATLLFLGAVVGCKKKHKHTRRDGNQTNTALDAANITSKRYNRNKRDACSKENGRNNSIGVISLRESATIFSYSIKKGHRCVMCLDRAHSAQPITRCHVTTRVIRKRRPSDRCRHNSSSRAAYIC